MKKADALALGKEDKNGALVIFDQTRDPKIEHALGLLAKGKSNAEAAQSIGICESELLGRISINTDYYDYYTRAKVSKGIHLIENLLEAVENIEEKGYDFAKINALRLKIDTWKFVAGKYAPHFGNHMEKLSLTIPPSEGTTIVIKTAPDKPKEPNPSDEAIDIE